RTVAHTKEAKSKVQAAIQGGQGRVTGKKRADLQEVIAVLRGQNFNMPLQFTNFRERSRRAASSGPYSWPAVRLGDRHRPRRVPAAPPRQAHEHRRGDA